MKKKDTCSSCVFRHRELNGELFCREHPPTATILMGAKGPVGQMSTFPKVEPNWWCGKHCPEALEAQANANDIVINRALS